MEEDGGREKKIVKGRWLIYILESPFPLPYSVSSPISHLPQSKYRGEEF